MNESSKDNQTNPQISPDTIDVVNVGLNLNFPFKFSLLIFVFAVTLDVAYYYFNSTITDTLIFISATTAAGGAILAAFYTSRILAVSVQQNCNVEYQLRENKELDKKIQALRYIEKWNNPTMLIARKICREIINMRSHGLEDIRKAIGTDEQLDDIIHLLNFFEEIAIAIKEETANEVIVREFYEGILIKIWNTLALWIENYRKEKDDENMWSQFENIHNQWIPRA